MTGFFRHIAACNPPIDEVFLPWTIGGQLVGWLRPGFARELARFPEVFEILEGEVRLSGALQAPDARSAALDRVARELARDGVISPYMGEPYAVTPGERDSALCVLDRAAAAHFGVRSFGQHLNGFVRRPDGIHMWLGRRSRDRLLFPGALDNMVAGTREDHKGEGNLIIKEEI